MAAAKKIPKIDHHKTVLARELIATQVAHLQLSPTKVAEALGYSSGNIVSMMMNGTMKLPANKAAEAARILHLDPLFLFRCLDAESGMNLISVIESVASRPALTENEARMINAMREVNRGMDLDMDDHPEEMAAIINAYTVAGNRARDSHDANLGKISTGRKSSSIQTGLRRKLGEGEGENDAAA